MSLRSSLLALVVLVGCAPEDSGMDRADDGALLHHLGRPHNHISLPPVENCSDGIDNDGDGKVDAADPDCQDAVIIGTAGNGLQPPMPWDIVWNTFEELGEDPNYGFWSSDPGAGFDGNGDGVADAFFGNANVGFAIDGRVYDGWMQAFGGYHDDEAVVGEPVDFDLKFAFAFEDPATLNGRAPERAIVLDPTDPDSRL